MFGCWSDVLGNSGKAGLASVYLKRSRIDIPHVQFFGT
jgi:hypothetical protein